MVTEDSMLHRLFRPEELELLLCGSKVKLINHCFYFMK